MILSFKDQGTLDVFDGRDTREARRSCPPTLWSVAIRKLDQLDSAKALTDMAAPPGNRLEALKGSRKGSYSVRINERYRLCFGWSEGGPFDA